jgi:DNA adenine methylase
VACPKSELIARIAQIAELRQFVNVQFGDGLAQIKKDLRKTTVFYYVDPPYYLMGDRLYRHSFTHKDHKDLATTLMRARFPWILSYDSHHVIEFLYQDCHVKKHAFLYSVKASKRDSELVIANFKLPNKIFKG